MLELKRKTQQQEALNMIRLTLPLIAMLIWDAVEAQNVLGSMMWPSYSGINAQLGMAGAAEEPCSTGDL